MDITDKPFDRQVHKAYTLAIISLLDMVWPELDILDTITKIAENIYEQVVIPHEGGPSGTEENDDSTGEGSENTEVADGSATND